MARRRNVRPPPGTKDRRRAKLVPLSSRRAIEASPREASDGHSSREATIASALLPSSSVRDEPGQFHYGFSLTHGERKQGEGQSPSPLHPVGPPKLLQEKHPMATAVVKPQWHPRCSLLPVFEMNLAHFIMGSCHTRGTKAGRRPKAIPPASRRATEASPREASDGHSSREELRSSPLLPPSSVRMNLAHYYWFSCLRDRRWGETPSP